MFSRVCIFSFLTLAAVATRAGSNSPYPAYLNEKYCEKTAAEFMLSSISSLQNYRERQLSRRHRGGMNNIRRYMEQRRTWLQECDHYLSVTSEHRLFGNDETTDSIFDAMDSVEGELRSLVSGVIYSPDDNGNPLDLAGEKFDQLFELVDIHKNLMLLKGQLVVR